MGQSDSRLPLEEGQTGADKSIIDAMIDEEDDDGNQNEWLPEDENENDDVDLANPVIESNSTFGSCAVSAEDDDDQVVNRDRTGKVDHRHGLKNRKKKSKSKRKHGMIPEYRRRNMPRASNPREKPPLIEDLIRLFPWDKSLKQYGATIAVKHSALAIVKPKPRSVTSAQAQKKTMSREKIKNNAPPWTAKPTGEIKSKNQEKGTVSESKKANERDQPKLKNKRKWSKPKSSNSKRSK